MKKLLMIFIYGGGLLIVHQMLMMSVIKCTAATTTATATSSSSSSSPEAGNSSNSSSRRLIHNLTDLLPDNRDDIGPIMSIGQKKKFIINGTIYDAVYKSSFVSTSIPHMISKPVVDNKHPNGSNSSSSSDRQHESSHKEGSGGAYTIYDFFHDPNSNAAFTIITYVDADGHVDKHLRGNIFGSHSEIVIEPTTNAYTMRVMQPVEKRRKKRQTNLDMDAILQIFKKQISLNFLDKLPSIESVLNLLKNATNTAAHRNKRTIINLPAFSTILGENVDAYVKLLSVADYNFYKSVVNMFNTTEKKIVGTYIEAYLCQTINIANMFYSRSLQNIPYLNITLVPSYFLVTVTPEASKFSTSSDVVRTMITSSKDKFNRPVVDGEATLTAFNKWLLTYKYNYPSSNKDYDLAIAFIGANIYGTSDILGIANTNSMCTSGMNGILVEENLGFFSAQTIAHEIAHTLGIQHDVDMNNTDCLDQHNYVMSSSLKNQNVTNSFYFSNCSILAMLLNINRNRLFPCILDKIVPDADVVRFTNYAPGQLKNITEQCKYAYGPTFYPMFGTKAAKAGAPVSRFEDEICTLLWCTGDGKAAVGKMPAAEKSSCGDGKWCETGVCVANSNAPRGDCLLDEDFEYCESMAKQKGLRYVCLNYGTGKCCKYCNTSATVIKSSHSMSLWLSNNTVDNFKYLDTELQSNKCQDDPMCETGLKGYFISHPDACSSSKTVVGIYVRNFCKFRCGLCTK